MKVALVYDRVNKWGGAERVLLSLFVLFPQATLFTSVYNKDTAAWADDLNIKTSFLQNFPFAKSNHELYPALMPLAFESFDFSKFDLVISVTSESAKGIITSPKVLHICYLLTPTRYLWSGYKEYFSSQPLRFLTWPIISYLRAWDKIAIYRPDHVIAISEEVKERINKYYKLDTPVIYPPVSLGLTYKPKEKVDIQDTNYYLIVSRLVSYKRVDLAVKVCTKYNLNLIVIGVGSELEALKQIAGPSVKFIGSVNDDVLCSYYENANALLYPGVEDFGISMVESQAFGTPVVAFAKGGALEIVIDNKTGILFEKQTVKSLYEAISAYSTSNFVKKDIIKNAQKFSETNFLTNFNNYINKYLANL